MVKKKKSVLDKKKSQAHLLMVGALLLIAVIVLFAVINMTRDTKENVGKKEETTQKSGSIIVSPNIVSINSISCNSNENAKIDLTWNPIVGFGDYFVVIETYNKQKLDAVVQSTGTNKLNKDILNERISFDIPNNTCNETYYFKIEVTKDNQKEESLKKKVSFDVTHQITEIPEDPDEPECNIIPINGEIYYLEHLAYIDTNTETLSEFYTLQRDLDFSNDDSYCQPDNYKEQWTNENGWMVIGSFNIPFTGIFNGNNKKIKNLYINRPAEENGEYLGLFGHTRNATINNLKLEDVSIFGYKHAGALSAFSEETNISNCSSSGSVSTIEKVAGGLIGVLDVGTVTNSYSNCNVSSEDNFTGGLIAAIFNGSLNNSFATGNVSGITEVGGLVGYIHGTSDILNSYSIGNVNGQNSVGGFVGSVNGNNVTIIDSYSLGDVIIFFDSAYSSLYVGGFIGNGSTIYNCYSTGRVIYSNITDPTDKGFSAEITYSYDNYWNIDTSLQLTSQGEATGLTENEMKNSESFNNWDFENIWAIDQGNSYPYLRNNHQNPLPGSN